ncbi:MAG: sulfatase [Planctomycetota bacterium]|nr:sulfatase [Planctomycetota bacterium]
MKFAPNGIGYLLACLLACTSCSDSKTEHELTDDAHRLSSVPTRAVGERPVRLAPTTPSSDSPVVMSVTPDNIEALHLLDSVSGTLRPASRDDSALQVTGRQIKLIDPDQLMVIFFELEADDFVSVRARLDVQSGLVTSEPCQSLRLIRLRELDDGESLQSLRAEGGLPKSEGRRTPLGKAILHINKKNRELSLARWASPPAADGLATARKVLPQSDQPTLWAAVLAGDSAHPIALGNLQVVHKPVFERLSDRLLIPTTKENTAATWVDLKVGGEQRTSLIVPPGISETLEVEIPTGASRLSFGVCVPPGQPFGARTRWFVEREDDDWRQLASGELTVRSQQPLRIHVQDIDAPWPESPEGPDRTRLRFRVEGNAPVAFGAPVLLAPAAAAEPRPPNLLLISLDTLRADHLGCYGYERPTSPFLDAFADRATLFTDAQTVAPYTLPSHVSLFTGLLPPSHGVLDGGTDRLDATVVPYLPKLLADAGWVTAAFTGGGFVSSDYGFAAGFDRFAILDPLLNMPAAQDRMGTAAVQRWIDRHHDTPWFLFLHSFATHDYAPPEEDFALFDTRAGPPSERRELALFPGPDGHKHADPTPEQVEDMRNLYDASIRYADRMIGQLLDSLEQNGRLDNTFVVITSDHGEEFGEHRGMKHARSLHREMLHVPLIVRIPGQTEAHIVRDPVSLTDLFPTLLELMGLPPTRSVDGRTIAPLLPDGNRRTSDLAAPILLGHIDTHTSRRSSLQVGPLKIIRGDMSDTLEFPASTPWLLYDVREDPGETIDLSGQRPEDLATLRQHLETLEAGLRTQAAPGTLEEVDEAVLEQLRALGYVR